jgi:hypothetical protein
VSLCKICGDDESKGVLCGNEKCRQQYERERNRVSESKVERVIKELNGRKGFDHWWDGIDGEYQREIVEELKAIIDGEPSELQKDNERLKELVKRSEGVLSDISAFGDCQCNIPLNETCITCEATLLAKELQAALSTSKPAETPSGEGEG